MYSHLQETHQRICIRGQKDAEDESEKLKTRHRCESIRHKFADQSSDLPCDTAIQRVAYSVHFCTLLKQIHTDKCEGKESYGRMFDCR